MSIKANIQDFDVLKNIQTRDIVFYLEKNNWIKVRKIAGTIIFDSPDSAIRVWVPLEGGVGEDYAISISKLLSSVASFEDRSQLDIFEDFDVFSIGDIVRIGSEDPLNKSSSSIPFGAGRELIKKARKVLLSGASVAASSKARAFYGSRKPNLAREYIDNLRLGQTERGSYIIKAISPLPTEYKDNSQGLLPAIPEKPPFERVAVEKTFISLNSLSEVLYETEKRGKFYMEPFLERISSGVNADLCEAIIGSVEDYNKSPLNFSVSWSPSFRVSNPVSIRNHLVFPVHHYAYIAKAAKEFRKKEPEEIILTGYVVNLHKEEEKGNGDVTVMANIGGKSRKVRMTLNPSDYKVATECHKNWLEVSATGVIEKGKIEEVKAFFTMSPSKDIFESS